MAGRGFANIIFVVGSKIRTSSQSQKTGLPYSFLFHKKERLPPGGIEHCKKENKYFSSVHCTPEAEFMNVYSVAVSGHNLEGLEVYIYNVYTTNQFQTTFVRGGGVRGGG